MFKIRIDNDSSPLDGRPARMAGTRLVLNRAIYKTLGSVEYNALINENDLSNDVVGVFLHDMQGVEDGTITDPAIINANTYLGLLGMEEGYIVEADQIDLRRKLSVRYVKPKYPYDIERNDDGN